jgi:hypothetical protein
MLLDLHAWIERAPEEGVPAYIHPLLQDVTQTLFGPCKVHLLLFPEFRGKTYHAHLRYWQAFSDESPFVWDKADYSLVQNDQFEAQEEEPPPGLCVMLYPSHEKQDTLLWPAAFHEIGHYLYETLLADALKGSYNDCLSKLADQHSRISVFEHDTGNGKVYTFGQEMSIASWLSELFCDMFAELLIGPAYVLALRWQSPRTSTNIETTHPPLAWRLKCLQEIVAEQCVYLPQSIKTLVQESANPKLKLKGESDAPWASRGATYTLVKHLEKNLEQWIAICRSVIDGIIKDSSCPVWQQGLEPDAMKEYLTRLINMLLAYVPPVGRICFTDKLETQGLACVSVEPAPPGPMFLAAMSVRFSEDLWERFSKPWLGSDKPEKGFEALNKLMVKALADSHVERGLRRGS